MKQPTQDKYEAVINTNETYEALADTLRQEKTIVFAWSDEDSSQMDILMVYRPTQFGHLQRGMSTHKDLFVAVSGEGMFGFALNTAVKAPAYVAEKLGMKEFNTSSTLVKLTDLINGVCRELEK